MIKNVIILPETEQDVTDAYDWYQTHKVGLEEDFLQCVDICIQSIQRNPEMYAIAHEGYRRALIRRFPYAIFYEYLEDELTLYAVFHCSQDPKKWRNRLR